MDQGLGFLSPLHRVGIKILSEIDASDVDAVDPTVRIVVNYLTLDLFQVVSCLLVLKLENIRRKHHSAHVPLLVVSVWIEDAADLL